MPLRFLEGNAKMKSYSVTRFPMQPCELGRSHSNPHFTGEQMEAKRGHHLPEVSLLE